MNRFFAFGCSFTELHWPTWADILGLSFNEYYNYGKCGCGNDYIKHQIIKADLKHGFNENDLIIVQWSTYFRVDRRINKDWEHVGHIWSEYISNDNKLFLEKFWDNEQGLLNSLDNFYLIKNLLGNKKSKYFFTSMMDINSTLGLKDDKNRDTKIFKEYPIYANISNANWVHPIWEYVEKNDHLRKIIFNGSSKKMVKDLHPTPKIYYKFLDDVIFNKINFTENQILFMKNKSIEWHDMLMDKKLIEMYDISVKFNPVFDEIRKNKNVDISIY